MPPGVRHCSLVSATTKALNKSAVQLVHDTESLNKVSYCTALHIYIAFIHHEGRHTIRKVEMHTKTYNETQKYTMNIQTKIQKIQTPTYHIKQWTQSNQ